MSLETSLTDLLSGPAGEVLSYLNSIEQNFKVGATNSKAHSHYIRLDGNGRPRVADFVQYLVLKVTDFIIPRSEIVDAHNYYLQHNSMLKINALRTKAKSLFNKLKKTGEPGELLLYILQQEVLKLPQLICKMPNKTDSQMPIHGVDGIHVGFDDTKQMLSLYWGESKIYQNLDAAINNCFTDLSAYLLAQGGSNSPLEREFQLIRDNLDLCDEKLENALLEFLDKDNPKFNQVVYKGSCLIGFDDGDYPNSPNTMLCEDLKGILKSKFSNWASKVDSKISSIASLDSFELHVFLLPFPNVQAFRDEFLKQLQDS